MTRIVHLVISDLLGAGRAALRISEAVKTAGYESEVYALNPGPLKHAKAISLSGKEKLLRILTKKENDLAMRGYPLPGYFHYDKYALNYKNMKMIREADLIHVHWINEGIYSDHFLKDLNKPVVWTMHDMWSFTGGCHYAGGCRKFTGQCGNCPCLGSGKADDLSSEGQKMRIREYGSVPLQFVGCSRWITDEANASRVFRESGMTCIAIPNPIEDRWFHVRDQKECRRLLGIETEKKLILTGSINLKDERKGCRLLLEALKRLDPEEYMLATFGNPEGFDTGNMETIRFGSVFDDLHLSLIYGACDVFAAPSRQENLANTVMESIACGLPAAAFEIGGMPDMISPGKNGYLARPFDAGSLAESLVKACGETESREAIAADTQKRFSLDEIGQRYGEVYRSLLGQARNS